MNDNLMRVKEKDKKRIEEVSQITGLPYTKTFGIFSETMPLIINSEIIRKPKSKNKKLRLTFIQEYEIPKK